jgi:hypothetical protein
LALCRNDFLCCVLPAFDSEIACMTIKQLLMNKLTQSNIIWKILIGVLLILLGFACAGTVANDPLAWPALTREMKAGAYWWWHGSAVDTANLTRELERAHDAGFGAVHIIPIFGTRGSEARFIDYLSPKWMEMLDYTISEADRLGLNVDMTTGTGWCFGGGPNVGEQESNASVVAKTCDAPARERLRENFDPGKIQALMAFGPDGKSIDLTRRITASGSVDWMAPGEGWHIFAVSQKPSGQMVKRAAPGDEGPMLNLIFPDAMRKFLAWFRDAFKQYRGPKPRAQYHDSYEYRSDWAPDFFAQFEKRRGYRLQTELPALFSDTKSDRAARVKSDYRETVSDVMIEESMPLWVNWSHQLGSLTRNEAHGAPGNWLDLYAVADIPETEMFHLDRSKLISKFASSAAHVSGRKFVAAETGTWVEEHFTETLADMKFLLDDLFLSGVNHVFYHGWCYSPDEAAWPGWLFYASYEMNPRNSVWRDVPALNAYVARCQSLLQSGRPDNDILLYWPLYDLWHNPEGLVQPLNVREREWFETQPIGKTALQLWNSGYAFDYISDRQLKNARADKGIIQTPGGNYRAILIPRTEHMPVETLQSLLSLAESGATVIFETQLPADVSGWSHVEKRRRQFHQLLDGIKLAPSSESSASPKNQREKADLKSAGLGRGRILAGDPKRALQAADIARERMFDREGLMCIRRATDAGTNYFITNRSQTSAVNGWIPISRDARSVILMDPMTGRTGVAKTRTGSSEGTEVYVQLQAGASIIFRCFSNRAVAGPAWNYLQPTASPRQITGRWTVKFLQGGPELPAPFSTNALESWTKQGDANAQRFAGSALYTLAFDAAAEDAAAAEAKSWLLDLGKVGQSARVRLNGQDLGTLIAPPFRVTTGELKSRDNLLEVEVTNVSANRIRDLDRRSVQWKIFYDINFVNIDYRPFNAADWPLTDSGLLGPVTLTPLAR